MSWSEVVVSYPFVSAITEWLNKEDGDALDAIAEYVAAATPTVLEKMDRHLRDTTVNE